jgi:CRP-like cAMP-binding protein
VQALISGDHNHSASPSPAASNNVDWLQEETNPDPSNAMLSSALAAPRADRGLTGFLSIIDWACEFVDVNRWKRYFCTLLDGKLRYYASPDAPLWLGEITLAGVTACANIEKDTVGYNRAAAKLNDSEMAELRRGAVFALVSDGHLYLFDTRSKKDTTVWIEHIRQHMPAASHVSGMENKKDGVKHSKEVEQTAHQWKEKTKQLGNRAWPDAFTLFGEPLRHLLAGETCGESAFFDHRFRSQTALALEPCVLVELHCESLLQRDLLESVMPGSMWMFLNNLLRHEPMERMNTEVDYILTAVNYMPFFHQLPTNVQRSMLEVCTCHAVPDGPSVVLGRYAGPFNATSSVPLYIVLQGKIEIYQGHTMLKEGIEALGQAGFQDIHRLFPQKVQRVHAEEAWGGPQLIQESDNQKLCRMLEEVVHEVDQKKVKALRSLIKEHIDSTTYTVVAEEGTHYLQIEQSEWSSIFAQVRNVVFRTSSLFRILQKTPRERTPQQAHLAACLLHGYVFFQQLPFRNILDLAYTITLITVEAGTVLAKEGTALNRVLIVLAGTATLHKSPSANNLRLPIGPGKNVTLEDARVFFGPVGLTICAGDSFGMAYVFAKGSTPSHSLVASSRCHLLQISAEDFRAKVGKFTNDFTPLPDAILVTIRKPAKARMPSESHDLAQCLGTVGLLRQCPTRLLDELKDYVTVEGADAGAILQAEGDKTQALNVIISGSASIHSHQYQGVTGPRGGDDNELGSPTPSDLSMKWGMCENVIQVGGSFGDLILTTGLPRSNTVIAREPCQYIRFDKDNIPALAFEDLRDFVASNQGVPPGLKKSPDVRSDYDLVQGAGFLSKFEYFRDYSLESMAKLSKIAEYLTFDKGDTIQTNNTTILGTFLFLVHGGKVELRPQEDVSSVLFAGLSLRNRPSNSETQRTSAVCSSVASACLKKIATEGFQDRSDVLKAVESALRKSSQLMSPEKKMVRSRSSVTHSLLDPTAGVEATKPMEEVSFLEYGKHFILGHAMAFERTQLVRINLAAWRGIVLEQVESELSSKVTFLSQMKAFASWKHKDLAALAARTKIVKFPKNAPVIMKGQALTTILYIVKAGACSLHGTLNLAGTQCVDMAADDKLYSTSRPQVASIDEDYSTKITNR